MASPFSLENKVVIVTGSSRGIGRSIAEHCALLGAKVVVSSRKADACEEVAAGIKENGGDATVIPCNISRKPEVEALVAGTIKQYGGIDVLVCNAAVNPYYGPLGGISDEQFDKIMASNIKSNLWLCNLSIPEHGRTRRRLGDHRVVDRRHSRLGGARRLRHLEGGGFLARPQPRGRVGTEECSRELHRSGTGEDRFRQGACGTTRKALRSAMRKRRCAASARRTRSAASRRFSPGRRRASSPAR